MLSIITTGAYLVLGPTSPYMSASPSSFRLFRYRFRVCVLRLGKSTIRKMVVLQQVYIFRHFPNPGMPFRVHTVLALIDSKGLGNRTSLPNQGEKRSLLPFCKVFFPLDERHRICWLLTSSHDR